MTKIKEIRCIQTHRLRSFCIRHDYFNAGTNEEYDAMFELVRHGKGYDIDIERLRQVAEAIREHTAFPELTDDVTVGDIMAALAREVVEYYYEEDDE